jgi:hypothetical protein
MITLGAQRPVQNVVKPHGFLGAGPGVRVRSVPWPRGRVGAMMRTVAGGARTWRYLAVVLGSGGLAVAAGYPFATRLPSPQLHLFWIAVTVLPAFLLAV